LQAAARERSAAGHLTPAKNLECDAFEGEGPFVYTDETLTVTITNAEDGKSFDRTSASTRCT